MVKGRVDSAGSAVTDRVVPGDGEHSQSAAGTGWLRVEAGSRWSGCR